MLPYSHPIPLTDQKHSHVETLASQRRACQEARRASSERALATTLAELGITPSEASLFNIIHYGLTLPPPHLTGRAASENYRLAGSVTEEGCRAALTACLAKGWLQVIDEAAIGKITDDLRGGRFLGPIYGFPPVGGIDFTHVGAELWLRICGRCFRGACGTPFAYTDVVHEKTARYYRTRAAAITEIERVRDEGDVVSVAGPFPTGPWRAQWWRRFPEGYRINIEERRQWRGRSDGGGEECYMDYSAWNADPGQLRHVLDRHNVTVTEWLLLESMEEDWFRESAANLCHRAAESGSRLLGVSVSEEQCCDGLEACLRYGWLRVVDQHTTDEVQSLLGHDPVLLAVPRTAENCLRECCYSIDALRVGKLVPIPPARRWGEIDFSPAGAGLYRMVSAEWLGPDWEDDLRVSRGYSWEEHSYCEAQEGFEGIVQEHVARGDVVRVSRVVTIGPWCVYWWERFPGGYRLELELAEP